MTEQIQILQRRLECFSRALKELATALKVFSMYLGGNSRWVPLSLRQTLCAGPKGVYVRESRL